MFRHYLSDAIKNIKSNITLAVIVALLFTFLIQILSYSFAWVTYNFWFTEISNSGLTNESYIEYSVYSVRITNEEYMMNLSNVFNSGKLVPDSSDPTILRVVPFTEEEQTEHDAAIAAIVESYDILTEKLKAIDGYILSKRSFGAGFSSDDSRAYELSTEVQRAENTGREIINSFLRQEEATGFYSSLGYTMEQIRGFCHYNAARIDVDSILLEGLTYCKGEGFTEENLRFDYTISPEGQLPVIPIVMGYSFMQYYDIGDIINHPEGPYYLENDDGNRVEDQNHASYVIVGFLNENTNLEDRPGQRTNVDDYIIIPKVPNTSEYFPEESKKSQARDFYKGISRYFIYVEKDNEQQTIEALSKAFAEDDLLGTNTRLNENEQVNAVYKQMYKKRMINFGLIAGVVLAFCVTVIIVIIINKFNNSTKDIAIHRLVGATSGDVVRTYVLEFAIYLLCADILSHYVYIIYAFDRTSAALIGFWMTLPVNGVEIRMIYPLMLVMNIVFLAIVAIIAYICSSKLDTAEIIKGKE
jgi:hypothetical protein